MFGKLVSIVSAAALATVVFGVVLASQGAPVPLAVTWGAIVGVVAAIAIAEAD